MANYLLHFYSSRLYKSQMRERKNFVEKALSLSRSVCLQNLGNQLHLQVLPSHNARKRYFTT